jgi:hypothetical protein
MIGYFWNEPPGANLSWQHFHKIPQAFQAPRKSLNVKAEDFVCSHFRNQKAQGQMIFIVILFEMINRPSRRYKG